MTETTYRSPGGVVTITIDADDVDVKVATGYLYREQDLEKAIADVLGDILTDRSQAIHQLTTDNITRSQDLIRNSGQKMDEWLDLTRELTRQLEGLPHTTPRQ